MILLIWFWFLWIMIEKKCLWFKMWGWCQSGSSIQQILLLDFQLLSRNLVNFLFVHTFLQMACVLFVSISPMILSEISGQLLLPKFSLFIPTTKVHKTLKSGESLSQHLLQSTSITLI